MKFLNAIAATAAVITCCIGSPIHASANTKSHVCTFNHGYGTPVKARMQCQVSWLSKSIHITWKDGVRDVYRLQYGNTYTDTRGGIWNLTTTRETGPTAALLYNPGNNNQVIIE